MQYQYIAYLFLLLNLLLNSCAEQLITIEEVNNIAISDCALFSQTSYIINDTAAYNQLQIEMNNTPECIGILLPNIDFGEKTLLGKLTSINNVCAVNYKHEILADTDAQNYIYRITVSKTNGCNNNYSSMNWITVPKMPTNYSVLYEIVE